MAVVDPTIRGVVPEGFLLATVWSSRWYGRVYPVVYVNMGVSKNRGKKPKMDDL